MYPVFACTSKLDQLKCLQSFHYVQVARRKELWMANKEKGIIHSFHAGQSSLISPRSGFAYLETEPNRIHSPNAMM